MSDKGCGSREPSWEATATIQERSDEGSKMIAEDPRCNVKVESGFADNLAVEF